tara:strand:+ start:515 stop:1234 length:720 start_codon:yes stop_codon:yes gene_type:complete
MGKSIGIAVVITVLMLWGFGKLMDSAMADVTGAGATTNDQVTSGQGSSNTAITGGYHSEATTNYQSGSSSNSTTTNTTNNNSYTGDTRVVPSANAAAIGNMNQMVCTSSVSGGVQKFGLGVSVASHQRDKTCELVLLAKTLHLMNMKVAAVSLLCTDPRIFLAMSHAGTHCPYNSLIGSEAEEHYAKYPKLRPDYETYTKDLRYIEEVDKENQMILEDEYDRAKVITDGNGNPIKLGNE